MSQNTFHYNEEIPSQWAKCFSVFKEQNLHRITIPIPWGAHETTQGVRDFTKATKLRLEKVLTLAAENGLCVDLLFSFQNTADTFPQWTFSRTTKTLVPSGYWDDTHSGFFLSETPSIFDSQVFDAFKAFISDVLSVAGLYAFPEGPVEGLKIDLSLFQLDQGLLSVPDFFEELRKRYSTVEMVNVRYNTNFKTIDSLCSKQGFKSLFEKRPWLAAYDYRSCREALLEKLKSKIAALETASLKITFSEEPQEMVSHVEKVLAIDPVLYEDLGTHAYPFLPEGQINPLNAFAVRIAEYLKENTIDAGFHFKSLPIFHPTEALLCDFLIVTCGKYMTRSALKSIERVWMRGSHVLFPFGLPQFDENMSPIDWLGDGERKNVSLEGTPFSVYSRGLGKIWVPIQLSSAHNGVFAEIKGQVALIERNTTI